ncbi:MAG: hypothetical protein QM214_02515 [Bacillota bacterium]|jgi:hypothetical protein|nr:hypothetical protein [Bacillota bacterium]HHU43024.1 hypothetical protein [Clostridiales bacterium]
MKYQEFCDKLSEAIFMNIEEVESIEEQKENDAFCFSVKIQGGEIFEVEVKQIA